MTTTRITNPKDYVAGFRAGMKEQAATFDLAARVLHVEKWPGEEYQEIEDALKALLMVFAKRSGRLADDYTEATILSTVIIEED